MNDKIKNFWYQDEDTVVKKISDTKISEVEYAINKELPKSFKEIYLSSNGGIAFFEGVEIDGEVTELHPFVDIEYLINQSKDKEILSNVYIFSSMAHSWYALDYRESGQPKVIYFDEYTDKIYSVADSFDDFIDKLIEVEE